MRIGLVCVEDGLMSVGIRKMAAYVRTLHPDTTVHYVPYTNYRSLAAILLGRYGECADVPAERIREVAEPLARYDLLGFSSMTGYASLTAEIIRAVRALDPSTYVVWGGIHPIVVPEEAIQHADAVCTGEGELAFEEFLDAFREGRDFTGTRNFWFRRGEEVVRNPFLPLMSGEEMSRLPALHYGQDELIYEPGRGYVELNAARYLDYNGLSYNTVWSIGCPLKCTFCGNTRFIENDASYRRIRHPGVPAILDEIEQAVAVHPHVSTVVFHDDSFLALPTETLSEFGREYRRRIGLPFCVQGVIPNYVKDEKLRILLAAGLNRVRMGIQNGSERILKFYDRPTPPAKIERAASILSRYRRYMIPPAYDVILDNPIETREDVVTNLEFLYRLARPYTLNVYSLRTIPNTELEQQLDELEISIDEITANYTHNAPTLANCLVFLIASMPVPRRLFDWAVARAQPLTAEQPHYPRLLLLCRTVFFTRRALNHLRHMDFSVLTGRLGYVLWKSGFIKLWRRLFVPRFEEPAEPGPGGGEAALPRSSTA